MDKAQIKAFKEWCAGLNPTLKRPAILILGDNKWLTGIRRLIIFLESLKLRIVVIKNSCLLIDSWEPH